MSIGRKDCVAALRNAGLSERDAKETVDETMRRKKNLAAAGQLERGAADLAQATMKEALPHPPPG